MVLKREIDRPEQRLSDALRADHNKRFQVVRRAAQIFSLRSFERFHTFIFLLFQVQWL
jgi:hypothetical protein